MTFESFVDEHFEAVRRSLAVAFGDRVLAEELAQDAFHTRPLELAPRLTDGTPGGLGLHRCVAGRSPPEAIAGSDDARTCHDGHRR